MAQVLPHEEFFIATTATTRDHGDGRKRVPHALVLGHPAGGHFPPAFYFSMELAKRGILVTLVSFDDAIAGMASKHGADLRSLELLRLRPVPRPALWEPGTPEFSPPLQQALTDSKLVEEIFGGPDPPTCLFVDIFFSWAQEYAQRWNIPWYTILGSGATLARLCQAVKGLFDEGRLRMKADDDTKFENFEGMLHIDGMPSVGYSDIPDVIRNNTTWFRRWMEILMWEADGMVVNSFHDLEAESMEALRRFATGQKYYAIGPLAPLGDSDATTETSESEPDNDESFRWLDSQPDSSVVYVCFGSSFNLTPSQVQEIGLALENSKHRFLWVLPKYSKAEGYEDAELLPPDFQTRIGERGYVLRGWAPQVKLLSHRAVGAFFTHCGWNSTLEGISRAQPMIAFPILAEQDLNRRVLVSKLKIASEIPWNPSELPDAKLVEEAIRVVMDGEEGKAMRGRAKVLQAAMQAALAPGGSSIRERDQLAKDIMAL